MTAAGSSPLTFGLCLPNFRLGASKEGIDAAVDAADRLGWTMVWTTDHLLPDTSRRAQDYASIFEAVSTLAYVAGRNERVGIGLSVLVVPMRNAVEQAKALASIDSLSRGRLTVGVGIGWSEIEYANAGLGDRFRVRGAYLDEAIQVWRHLWSGSEGPFHGRFQSFDEFRFAPLPAQGARVPILVGGRADAVFRRAGTLADGYHSSGTGPADYAGFATKVRSAAAGAGRPEPILQARCQVMFDKPASGFFALAGSAREMLADVEAFRRAGVSHLAVDLRENDPERVVAAMERFDREIVRPALALAPGRAELAKDMGELRPRTPVTRPETARPRTDSAADATAEAAKVAPPSAEEVDGISRHLALLAVHSGAGAVEDPHLGALLVHAAGGGIALNYAAMPRWTAADWRASLGRVGEAMRAAGEWPSLLLAERVDRPIGLERELPGAGWTQVGHETLLWVGAASVVPHLDPSLRIESVQPKNVDVHQELEAQIFGLGRRGLVARGNDLGDALAGGHVRAYLVRIGGEPVAVARLSVGEHDAGLYGVGVAKPWRRHGIGTLLTTVATRAGLALGKRIVWLSVEDGNDGARQMYERLGYRPLFGWGRWVTRDR